MQQLTAGGNIGLSSSNIEVLIKTNTASYVELDITAYLLDQTQKVRGDHDMVFYGQPQTANRSVVLHESHSKSPYQATVQFNMAMIDPQVTKIALCATLNEPNAINAVAPIQLEVRENGTVVATAYIDTQRKTEKALILAEVYQYKNTWKFRFVDQGFNGGLKPLAENFGVDIADADPTPTPVAAQKPVTPPPPSAPTVNLSKIKLDKTTSSISLTKKGNGFGKILVNLNWNQGNSKDQSFLKRLVKSKNIDLDLAAMIEFKDGGICGIQALGNRFGEYSKWPYVMLEGDDRTGSSTGGENLFINGDKWDEIERIVIYTFIYDGVARWADTDGVVTIKLPNQPEIEVRLIDGTNHRVCAIVMLENVDGKIQATREVNYFDQVNHVDDYYGFGFTWTQATKD